MAPDRLLDARLSAYVMIALALMVVGLAAWNVNLTRRVGEQESIRRAENRAAVERSKLGCRIFTALIDVSVDIPLMNLKDILTSNQLSAQERADRLAAQSRYEAARKVLVPALGACKA